MRMPYRYTLGLAATALLGASPASAQSAKFTAAWESDRVELAELAINIAENVEPTVAAEEVIATIHVPNRKELLIGVSGVANLVTFTEAKGRNGGFSSSAAAEGSMNLEVRVVPEGVGGNCGGMVPTGGIVAAPGELTFASRRQELTVSVDLDVVGALDDVTTDDELADMLDIEGSVTVALGLDSTAAHHFNFVAPDLLQGTYDVIACFSGNASGMLGEEVEGDNAARAYVAVMQRMLTVQEVRAVRDDFIALD